MRTPIAESLKEFARVCTLAAIPLLIDGLTANEINWRVILVVVAIAGLRFIDKALHEVGKVEGNDNLTRGLTRF